MSSSKRPASPPTIVQCKVAKKPSMITSRGSGVSIVATHSQQASEPHDNSDAEASNDVLLDHHHCNGTPWTLDTVYLASVADKAQANCGTGPSTAVQGADSKDAQDSLTGKPRSGSSDDPTTLKFYDTVWKTALIQAKASLVLTPSSTMYFQNDRLSAKEPLNSLLRPLLNSRRMVFTWTNQFEGSISTTCVILYV